MPLLNYTTGIEASKTVAEIQSILSKHGAKSILVDYGEGGTKVLTQQGRLGKVPRRYITQTQAVRVAWRILKDWVAAQMAILETEMVKMEQIFLPYVITKNGKTLYEVMVDRHFHLDIGKSD